MNQSTFESMSRGILSETHYVNHFSSAALYFKNNLSDFLFYARDGEYSQEFLQDCKERFSKLDPMSAQELHDRFFPPNGLPGDA